LRGCPRQRTGQRHRGRKASSHVLLPASFPGPRQKRKTAACPNGGELWDYSWISSILRLGDRLQAALTCRFLPRISRHAVAAFGLFFDTPPRACFRQIEEKD